MTSAEASVFAPPAAACSDTDALDIIVSLFAFALGYFVFSAQCRLVTLRALRTCRQTFADLLGIELELRNTKH